jgi:hypothetical protein
MRVWAIDHLINLPKSAGSRLSRIWPCFRVESSGYLTLVEASGVGKEHSGLPWKTPYMCDYSQFTSFS